MAPFKGNYYLEQFCQLVYAQKHKEAEQLLLGLIEESFSTSKNSVERTSSKAILHEIYCSFNLYYQNWFKKNNYGNKLEIKDLSLHHSNWLISNCTHAAEMDDLLFHLLNYPDTSGKLSELEKAFNLYKKNLS